MPIPFILGGLAVAAGVLGVAGHAVAKETNEKARKKQNEAVSLYEDAKDELENQINITKETIQVLGSIKKYVLENQITQFLDSFEKIKHIDFSHSVGMNEISKLQINSRDFEELKRLTDIPSGSMSDAALGGLAVGGIGSLATVGLGATIAFAGPAAFVTALFASFKADENLEKAEAEYAKAEAAAEEIENAKIACKAVNDKALMFNSLLQDLNELFSPCVEKMSEIIERKSAYIGKLKTSDFSQNELKLFATTASIAVALKQAIDTPILTKEGRISQESQKVIERVESELPMLENETNKALAYIR